MDRYVLLYTRSLWTRIPTCIPPHSTRRLPSYLFPKRNSTGSGDYVKIHQTTGTMLPNSLNFSFDVDSNGLDCRDSSPKSRRCPERNFCLQSLKISTQSTRPGQFFQLHGTSINVSKTTHFTRTADFKTNRS